MRALPRIVILATVIALFAFAFASSLALASKPNSATLTVTPNPVAAYSTFTVQGSGFVAGEGTTIVVTSPGAIFFFGGPADANGNINLQNTTNEPGLYKVEAYQYLHAGKSTQMATTTFTVQ